MECLADNDIAIGIDPRVAPTETVPNCGKFGLGWARYPKSDLNKPLKKEVMLQLIDMWEKGNLDKTAKVTAEGARADLVKRVIQKDWAEQANVTVPRIKAFFQKNATAMKELKDSLTRSEDPNNRAQGLEENFRGFVGKHLQLIVSIAGEEEVRLGTVVKYKPVKRRGRSNNIVIGGKFELQVEGETDPRKDVGHIEVEGGIRLYDETEKNELLLDDVEAIREAEIERVQELEECVCTNSTNRLDLVEPADAKTNGL